MSIGIVMFLAYGFFSYCFGSYMTYRISNNEVELLKKHLSHSQDLVTFYRGQGSEGWKEVLLRNKQITQMNRAIRWRDKTIAKLKAALKAERGPDYSDGCSKEGFVGGCDRMGCCTGKEIKNETT